jgi:CBS domain-containing protein
VIVSKVAHLIKDRPLARAGTSDTVSEACRILCELDTGALVVTDNDELVGVLSERDVIRRLICAGLTPENTQVAEIMTPLPQAMDAEGDVAQAIEIMRSGGFHHVPILDKGTPVGLLSADDIPEEYRMLLERFKEMRGR